MEEIKKRFLEYIKERISEQNFFTWFEPIEISKIDFNKNLITFIVPNKFFITWLEENYKNLIYEALFSIFNQKIDFNFIVSPSNNKKNFKNKNIEISEKIYEYPKSLNKRYRFDNFVVGPFNQHAHAAALAVAKSPSKSYNPLFIYSGVGLGKTHLLHAIGNYVFENHKHLKVEYVTCESFTNDLIISIREEKMMEFRNRYRSIDILLMDDIQFLAGKQATQEELFHTFNALYQNNKQIVFTSDRSPKEIPSLESRLKTRFEWGLIIDIQIPDPETLVAIINKKASENNIEIPTDVAFFLATNLPPNIRTIEGAIIRLGAISSLEKEPITEEFAKRVLKDILRIKDKEISIEEIQKIVADFFGLKPQELKSKKRSKQISLARQIAMYLSRKLTKLSYPHIGEKFGKKDHSTVIYAENQIKEKLQKDRELQNKINTLINIIKSKY